MSRSPHPSPPPAPEPPARSGADAEAVGLYERGLAALGRRDFAGAAALLNDVLTAYPREHALHERVRLYLKVCDRELQPKASAPRSLEEMVYAATIAMNAGRDEEALRVLRAAPADETGRVAYMLAAVHARRGARDDALAELRRAAEQDPENRVLARRDVDFEPLHEDEEFLEVTAPLPSGGRRRPRPRASR